MQSPRALASVLMLAGISMTLNACGTVKRNAAATLITAHVPAPPAATPALPQRPPADLPTFSELKSLAENPQPTPPLKRKLDRLFTRPSIVNSAPAHPPRSANPALGGFLRVATWNIEKSLHTREAAAILKSEDAFKARLKPAVRANPKRLAEALRQRERLVTADVLLLQEMDLGVPRSGYLDAAREIARALGMNYSYAPQQLEIDPALLGLEPGSPRPDTARIHGLFGLAVLSRHPILSAECFQLHTQPYDWYHGERDKPDLAESLRRLGARIFFNNRITREMKIGGRIYYRVDLHVPGLPGDRLTIIHNHLEIKTTTRGREAQLREILHHARSIPHTVVMAGDHNSASADVSPTSIGRVINRTSTDTDTWTNLATRVAYTNVTALARTTLNIAKNLHNPLATDIPIILPNRARRLFRIVEDFRFDDGSAFDTRGDRDRSINRSKALFANSNERYWMGFTPTFRVPRPIGPVGRTRLDWIFVKQPPAWQGSYRLAPHFGETLSAFDRALATPCSDHKPCVVDLPFQEPPGVGVQPLGDP